jgi:hypothetical protein
MSKHHKGIAESRHQRPQATGWARHHAPRGHVTVPPHASVELRLDAEVLETVRAWRATLRASVEVLMPTIHAMAVRV